MKYVFVDVDKLFCITQIVQRCKQYEQHCNTHNCSIKNCFFKSVTSFFDFFPISVTYSKTSGTDDFVDEVCCHRVGGWASSLLMVLVLLNVLFCCQIEILLLTRSVGFAALLQGWFSVFALQMCCKVALAVDVLHYRSSVFRQPHSSYQLSVISL